MIKTYRRNDVFLQPLNNSSKNLILDKKCKWKKGLLQILPKKIDVRKLKLQNIMEVNNIKKIHKTLWK